MTVSFHKYGDFFPGSGGVADIGVGPGKGYAVNVPLQDGITDEQFCNQVFEPVMTRVMEHYRPGAIVMQCGADSLAGDKLGVFNLTLKGHGRALDFMRRQRLPVLVLGGGGYTCASVSRCWTYETGLLLDMSLTNQLPYNPYMHCFGPDFKLHLSPLSNLRNDNSRTRVDRTLSTVFQNLRELAHAPSVQIHSQVEDFRQLGDDETAPAGASRGGTRDADGVDGDTAVALETRGGADRRVAHHGDFDSDEKQRALNTVKATAEQSAAAQVPVPESKLSPSARIQRQDTNLFAASHSRAHQMRDDDDDDDNLEVFA
ncbi:MAG: hypothetical protein MHM6MM_005943 [Cercozoa sp. M6MM]